MKNKLFFAVYTVIVFGLGALLTFMVMTQSHLQQIEQLKQQLTTNTQPMPTHESTVAIPEVQQQTTKIDQLIQQKTEQKSGFSTQDFNEQSAKLLLNQMSNQQLDGYVSRFISAKDAELITDKRQFANRAIEELYKANDNQPLVGQILLANEANFPQNSLNTHTLSKRQKIYAHLNTFGKVPTSRQVFIKWTNRSTGEVLLFEKKLISANSDTHWVSYRPHDSWQKGTYDIRFYQFNSQLEPIAQYSYDVHDVID